jgi:HemX protein
MATLILAAALLLYVASAAAYVAAFVRPSTLCARSALALAAAGFLVQTVAIALGCAETQGRHLLTVAGAAGLVGWLVAGAFLVGQRALRKPAAGALALPLVLAAALPEAFVPLDTTGAGPLLADAPALRLHVMTAAGGIALLALACAVGLMFLLQERELKGKRFGPLLSRLPPLHVLDRANAVLLAVGFGAFTVAVASGALVARSAWCTLWEWDGQRIASVLVWAVFGAMVLGRRAGNHGRRQAVMTIAAFALVLTTLVGVRQLGTTRHAALDAMPAVACVGGLERPRW